MAKKPASRNSYYEYEAPRELRESPTYAASGAAKALLEKHKDAINLTLGEQDISPSDEDLAGWAAYAKSVVLADVKKNALYKVYQRPGKGRSYPPPIGTPELRSAAAHIFSRDSEIQGVTKDDIVVSAGGKGVLNGICRGAFKPGDVVIVSGPGWVSNYDFWCPGIRIIEVNTHGRGLMNPEEMEQALKDYPEAKAVLINDPVNPTGARYSEKEREEVMEALSKSKALGILDDPYSGLNYDGTSLVRGPKETSLFHDGRLVVVNSVSKVYGCPDMRVGWAISKNKGVLKAVQKVNGALSTSIDPDTQNKAQLLLLFGDKYREATKARLRERAHFLAEKINAIDGLSMEEPKGAIYGWIHCKGLKDKIMPALTKEMDGQDREAMVLDEPGKIAEFMREVAHVAPVDGPPFYAPDSPAAKEDGWYIRVVLTDKAILEEACKRIKSAVSQLREPRARGGAANGGRGTAGDRPRAG